MITMRPVAAHRSDYHVPRRESIPVSV